MKKSVSASSHSGRFIRATLTVVAVTLCLQCAPPAGAQPKPAPASAPAKTEKPKPEKPQVTKWNAMDVGPFFSSGMAGKSPVLKAISIKLGQTNEAAVCFDTEMLRMAYGWRDGFVKLPVGRGGLEGIPQVEGELVFAAPDGPGWANAEGAFADGRPVYKGKPYGPLPRTHAKWRGLYLNGADTILSYTVGSAEVLEVTRYHNGVFSRSFEISHLTTPLQIAVQDSGGAGVKVQERSATVQRGARGITCALQGSDQVRLRQTDKALTVQIPKAAGTVRFTLHIAPGTDDAAKALTQAQARPQPKDLASLCHGGPGRWGKALETQGTLGTEDGAYVVDTLTLPEENPYNSWIRCSGFDFFKDGRAALCSVSGDVWLIDGIDASLQKLRWKRFATGLFQPLGLKIQNDQVYVLGRDQITRLHDLNGDGEADFYENFNNDVAITSGYHEFALDLQTDSKGNFYFAKGGDLGDARHPHHGCVIKVSADGRKLEVVATGLRAPNGMGMGPNDEISVSDNEGNWVPASRFSIIKPGGFYGHVFTSHQDAPPTGYDNPVCWLPKGIDNSSGGQVWVTSRQWGPFHGRMLHMSYGTSSLFEVMLDEVEGETQGAVVKFPLKFDSGIMRGRFHPGDGQLYVCGLSVWQSNAAKQGAFQRVRYTGKPVHMPEKFHTTREGLEVTFVNPLDESAARDLQNYAVERWNYRWTKAYGSAEYSLADPEKKQHDKLSVEGARLSPDGKTLFLAIADMQPAMQMKLKYNLKARDGTPLAQEIHSSVYKLPSAGK